jgi:CubicO group peptidase (beta-lactamase class C family)
LQYDAIRHPGRNPNLLNTKRLIIVTLLALLLNPVALFAQTTKVSDTAFSTDYDAFISRVMKRVPEIPSVAIVVVKNDEPVFLRAYGLADKEAGVKANTNTLYYIASSTKSFMAMAAALLDKDGKIKLDDPITKYAAGLPFKTSIPDKIRVRDLLIHTSGLRNSPLTFRMAYSGESDEKDMMRVFADATTYDDARYGKYAYDNLGYNIYGLLLQRTLNKKWQDLLQEKIFSPLGMNHTTAYVSKARARRMVIAESYMFSADTGTVVRSPIAKQDSNMQSAGGMLTSISDVGRWLRLNINDGKLDGKQVIPADIMKSVHAAYTQTTREQGPFKGNGTGEYGLGWQIGTYAGEKVIYHPGGFPGWSSHISYMPDKKIGVAVFINESTVGGDVGNTLATYAYDWLLGTADREEKYASGLEAGATNYGKMKDAWQASVRDRATRKSQLTRPLQDYVGRYRNEQLGNIEITVQQNTLGLRLGNIETVSTPFTQPETIRVEIIPGQGEVIKFEFNAAGQIVSLSYGGMKFVRMK